MIVGPIEQVIKLWETGQITIEQAIGKILLWLRTQIIGYQSWKPNNQVQTLVSS